MDWEQNCFRFKLIKNTSVIITGAPGRPIIYQPKGTLIDTTSFTLKWRKPQDTGGDNEIEYIVKYRDQSEAKPGPWKEFKTKELEYQIKDLDRNKKYKFEVIAKNRGGESNPDERFYRINVKPGMTSLVNKIRRDSEADRTLTKRT